MSERIIVLKIGGSVLTGERDIQHAVHEVYRFHRRGFSVVAVVSAFHGATDRLLERGRRAQKNEMDLAELLASGEREAADALRVALETAGVPNSVLDPTAIGLRTTGPRFDAEPVDLEAEAIRALFELGRVVIVPGFFGVCEDGGIALLGRGGSDLSALFVAARLDARCRLLKDVPALFEWDPAASGPFRPRAFGDVTFGTAERVGGRVLQQKAVAFARRNDLSFEIADWNSTSPTHVGAERDRFRAVAPRSRLRVALLGCGVVGSAVRDALDLLPQHFELTDILVRDVSRHLDEPRATVDHERIVGVDVDVVVETLGGVSTAFALVAEILARRKCVVTANKTLVAGRGEELAEAAASSGARLLVSATVGGATPILETAQRLASRLRRVECILNGTCAFVADRLARGRPLDRVLRNARRYGLAEVDATKDLSGADAVEKLHVLARQIGVDVGSVELRDPGFVERARQARGRSATIVQVGVLARGVTGWTAHVELREIATTRVTGHTERVATSKATTWRTRAFALARARAQNVAHFELEDGRAVHVSGAGAGGPPTAEAIVADLLDLARRFDPNSVVDVDLPGEVSTRGELAVGPQAC